MKRCVIVCVLLLTAIGLAWANYIPNGGLEGGMPNYFKAGGTSVTAEKVWATDAYRTGGRSLKIVKPNADGTAYWESEDLYRYWSVFVGQNVGMQVGAWVKLSGVNVNPTGDEQKVQLVFNFYKADGTNLLEGPLVLDVPQTAGTTDWIEVKSTEALSFPVTVDSITVKVVMGSQATGTVYVDDIFIRNTVEGQWVGDFFNCNVDVPTGWFYWWDNYPAGSADWATKVPVLAGATTEQAHSGEWSLKIEETDDDGDECVVNSDIAPFDNDGSPLVLSVWMKAELADGYAELANTNGSYGIGFTVTWHDGTGGADGWGEVGGTDYRFILPGDTTDWVQYVAIMTPPENARQFSLRARFWNFAKGKTYWDDFVVEKLNIAKEYIPSGGLEGGMPNYFKAGGTSVTAEKVWATDAYRTGGRSLKIVKPNADGTAYWESEDLYRYWSVFVGQNVGMQVGAWVKLSGVNVNPTGDEQKVQLVFNFYKADGTNLLEGPLVLDVPQTAGTTDWIEVKSTEALSFPVTVDSITVKVVMGSQATGTVYVDDIFIRNTVEGQWVGDFFNCNVDVPTGWFYWWDNYPSGSADWATKVPVLTGATTEQAHSGAWSLKIEETDDDGDECVVNSDIAPFDNDGSPLVLSVWMKAELADGYAELANTNGSYGIGFTVTWHDGTGGADGWGEVGGTDYRFILPGDTTDWVQYVAIMTPPENARQFSLRARFWNFAKGKTYWDDFSVKKYAPQTGIVEIPEIKVARRYELVAAYPNPFNPTTTIQFAVPKRDRVNLSVYDFMGRKVAELVNQTMDAGNYLVSWNARDNNHHALPSGIYFVVLQGTDFRQTHKVTLLK